MSTGVQALANLINKKLMAGGLAPLPVSKADGPQPDGRISREMRRKAMRCRGKKRRGRGESAE